VELCGVRAWAPVVYEGPARALVGALKFRRAVGVAEAMAAAVAAGAPAFGDGATLVPVPLHPARLRKRGFNQAERLAAAIASRTAQSVADCLRRTGTAGTQLGRPRAARLVALESAYTLLAGASVPERVTLIDDVITTGATLAACAAPLRRAGVREVCALAYARTPTR
jgi:ComF family protein